MTTRPHDVQDVDHAARAAAAAAAPLGAAPLAERAAFLRAVADRLDVASDELVAHARTETALDEPRLVGEVARTTGQLRRFADAVDEGGFLEVTIDPADPVASPPRPDLRRMLVPLGPVAVFGASNFPFAFSVAGGDTASALAAGCPVVAKVHPGHPATSLATAAVVRAVIADAGLPLGTFAVVEGFERGVELVRHPAVRAVAFTGSSSGGRALYDVATSRPDPIPFYGELGSINPVIVTPAAAATRAEDVAEGLIGSVTLGVGQFCTRPGVVLVPHGGDVERHVSHGLRDPAPRPMLHRGISDAYAQRVSELGRTSGVEVVAGDPATAVHDGDATPVVLGTDVTTVLADPDRLLAECFGPCTVLVRYADERELRRVLDVLPGSLTVTVQRVADDAIADGLFDRLASLAGRVVHDGWPTGVAVTHAQHHGGPWPSTTDPLHTSVGPTAMRRFLRPVTYQDAPPHLLPAPLRDDDPAAIPRRVNGVLTVPTRPAAGEGQ